ncbi:MAG: hypothetical protein Q9181_003283, partial [Wetmoreana brouardii]
MFSLVGASLRTAQWLRLLLLTTLLVSLECTIATPAAIAIQQRTGETIAAHPSQVHTSPSSSRHAPISKRVNVIFGTTNTFTLPGAEEHADDTWEIRLSHIASALPIEAAAAALDRFYMLASETVENMIGRGLEDDMQDF